MRGEANDPVTKARTAWGETMPGWVLRLAEECAATSQNRVSRQMGWSGSAISQVLGNKYPGDLDAIERAFKGAFEAATVACPELGEMPSHECQAWRKKARKFSGANSLRVRMFRACSRCALNKKGDA
ncbi:hypothetical protein RGUI_0813 [Rhodovulum sp. P5]|uniref:hypothetical protein n=1 Tax=Rhodovulum phage vB_RhkS_P1 TaxID=1873452 RepID=UPI00080AC1A9|nr:hypothetical protein [Rhodovulum sp. P5]YP_009285898.1 hypothetical protein BI026_gp13 [Rhodovulum phage vB_RhkS_P1]ANT39884.1 hypothetical protein Rhks_13 [Rhodovulum phage vB_RhkS_P1]ARE38954.1 hypothetical protein RGUI_0813 [Rhodovulum sp. P5]